MADDVGCRIGLIEFVDRLQTVERDITKPQVRPELVVVIDVFVDQIPQMPFSKDDEVVRARVFDRLDPALDVRVEVQSSIPVHSK